MLRLRDTETGVRSKRHNSQWLCVLDYSRKTQKSHRCFNSIFGCNLRQIDGQFDGQDDNSVLTVRTYNSNLRTLVQFLFEVAAWLVVFFPAMLKYWRYYG